MTQSEVWCCDYGRNRPNFTLLYQLKLLVNTQVNFFLEHAMKAQRGVEIKFYSFFSLGGRGGWGADVTTMVSQRRNRYVA